MQSQVWDSYFAQAFPALWSSECCRLRAQLQERERPGEGTPFATSSNFKITDISGGVPRTHVFNDATSLERLDRAVEDPASKGVRIISLAGTRGTSPLEITSPVAARLLRQHWVRPEYLRILLSFGNIPLEPEARNSYVSFHQDVNGNVSLAYRLVYSERNRAGAWTLRQIGIYHHRPQSRSLSVFGDLLILAAGTRQTRFFATLEEALAPNPAGTPNSAARSLETNPWSFHTTLLACYADSWRDYFRYLGSQYSPIGDRAMGTMGLRVDDETIRNVKTLRHLYDLSLFGGAACASNVDIARALVARFPAIPQGEADSLRASADMLGELAESCGVLQKKIKNVTDLVGHLIAFHYQVETAKLESEVRDVTARMATLTEENRDLTKQLRELAEGTSEMTRRLRDLTQNTASDGAIVSVITVVSAVYLPGSFVATVFGMNFFNFDEGARSIIISLDFWIFVVLWVVLMILTAGIFATIYHMKGGDASLLWKRLTGGGGAGRAGSKV
ncbi:hypothetical protein RB598_004237 [Gaeumannomyces tritici]